MSKGYALVDYWISRTSAKSLQSECTLQLISAERNFKQGNEKRAAELYVEALHTLELLLPNAYLTAISQYRLGVVYKADLKSQKEAEKYYLKSIYTHSAHFPHSISLASCLNNIANLHKDRNEYEAAETNYLKAIDICSAHFPQLLPHALCLYNLGTLLQMRKRKAEAVQILEAALDVYLHIGAHANATECRSRLQELRE
jgi:tetratricopeptide (TPR) repeat protein